MRLSIIHLYITLTLFVLMACFGNEIQDYISVADHIVTKIMEIIQPDNILHEEQQVKTWLETITP